MHKTKSTTIGLAIGAIGIVFGDIGTSPLYALRAIFGPLGQHLSVNDLNVYGILSLVIWSVTIVVSIKYIGFIMSAGNEGEGGIMALVAQVKSSHLNAKKKWFFVLLGLMGVALFYGDSAITPAISVLSAVEGLKITTPGLAPYVVPLALIVLAGLFSIQKYGTDIIGRLFGPVMIAWFLTIAVGGGWQVLQHPSILNALSPLAAIHFFTSQPFAAFIAMGAVVLAITGAEALYADMGHFGRPPIARAWFFFVFPALLLCYMGQGALMLHNPTATANPFFLLFPTTLHLPVIVLATTATLIASQSVISGAFSLTRQAVQLNFLPKMRIYHTSEKEIGQIYLPFVNLLLFVAVAVLIIFFGSSERLANAYGIAVSGTLAVDTILFLVVMRVLWRINTLTVIMTAICFVSFDLLLVTSNGAKIVHGGWFPMTLALIVLVIITTWLDGRRIITRERKALEGSLKDFITNLRTTNRIARVPGQAVYIGHHTDLTPLALHATVEKLHELHEKVTIVFVATSTAAHVPEEKRAVFNDLGYMDGISQLNITYGFHDTPNIPKTLKTLRHISPELDFDPDKASYFVSLTKVIPTKRHNLSYWRKLLYILMAQNALSASDYYKLPTDQTIEMRTLIEL